LAITTVYLFSYWNWYHFIKRAQDKFFSSNQILLLYLQQQNIQNTTYYHGNFSICQETAKLFLSLNEPQGPRCALAGQLGRKLLPVGLINRSLRRAWRLACRKWTTAAAPANQPGDRLTVVAYCSQCRYYYSCAYWTKEPSTTTTTTSAGNLLFN